MAACYLFIYGMSPLLAGKFLKAYYGCYAPVHDGKICRIDTQAQPHVGGDFAFGKTKAFGLIYGESSCPCWIQMGCWTGKKLLSMAASHRQKRGLLRRKNQKGQRNKVDGGGRRPRCSFGKHPCLGAPAEVKLAEQTLDAVNVPRSGRGRPG